MHLRHSPVLTRLTVMAGVLWLLTLIALTMSDVLTRGWNTVPTGYETAAAPAASPSTPKQEPAAGAAAAPATTPAH
jgi:hypothetical protein